MCAARPSGVSCPECGIAAREVPWAAHGPRFTYAFEEACCWCALSMSRAACRKLMRVSWRTVGSICSRVEARLSEARMPVPGGLVRIGVDETSYRKGCKYMAVIAFSQVRIDRRGWYRFSVPFSLGCKGLGFACMPRGSSSPASA